MLKILFASFILFNFLLCFSQELKCENRLDTATVIKIAKRHNAYWIKKSQGVPYITFDEQKCSWTVVSTISSHTNKGDCKYCNGCTITTSVTLLIDATSGKVKDRIELKHVTRNWE